MNTAGIKQTFNDLDNRTLSEGQRMFVLSLKRQFRKTKSLSSKQINILNEILKYS